MRTLPNPNFQKNTTPVAVDILKEFIPAVWKHAFLAPMAFRGRYEHIGIQSKAYPGLSADMFKDHLEVHYKGDTYVVSWEVDEPWAVKGGWLFSSNWKSSDSILPKLIGMLSEHVIIMAGRVDVR